jgi:hypothetical protein
MYHICVWDQGGSFKDGKGSGVAKIMQDGAVDLHHGAGVESMSAKPQSQVKVFMGSLKNPHLLNYCAYFSSLLKNKPSEGAMICLYSWDCWPRCKQLCLPTKPLVSTQTTYHSPATTYPTN